MQNARSQTTSLPRAPEAAQRAAHERVTRAVMAIAITATFGLGGLSACDDGERGELSRTDPSAPASATPGGQAPAAASSADNRSSADNGAFAYRSEVALLPFDVRLAKLARVAGIDDSDAILEPVRARRLDLGGYDYALGVKPDTTWTSARLALWVKSIKPLCASAAMRARYANLPEKLPDLVLAAYGRRATGDDRQLIEEALAGPPLDEAGRYAVVCSTVLSSLEFVAR